MREQRDGVRRRRARALCAIAPLAAKPLLVRRLFFWGGAPLLPRRGTPLLPCGPSSLPPLPLLSLSVDPRPHLFLLHFSNHFCPFAVPARADPPPLPFQPRIAARGRNAARGRDPACCAVVQRARQRAPLAPRSRTRATRLTQQHTNTPLLWCSDKPPFASTLLPPNTILHSTHTNTQQHKPHSSYLNHHHPPAPVLSIVAPPRAPPLPLFAPPPCFVL